MTIHKAKGLEFDRVILPGLGNPSRQDDPPLLLWQELADGELLISPISQAGSDGDPIYNTCRIWKPSEPPMKTRVCCTSQPLVRAVSCICWAASIAPMRRRQPVPS